MCRQPAWRPREPFAYVQQSQLRVALLEEWDNIPQRTISTLIDSMRNRCALVIEANGGVTRY